MLPLGLASSLLHTTSNCPTQHHLHIDSKFFSPFTCSSLASRVFGFKLRHEPRGTRELPGYLPTSDCSPSNSSSCEHVRAGCIRTNWYPHLIDLSVDHEQDILGVAYPLLGAGKKFWILPLSETDSESVGQQPLSTNDRCWTPLYSCELSFQRLSDLLGRKKERVFILIPPRISHRSILQF
ncbi:hypothetical protein F5Y06DRAFT_187707 [Hypoxylon sp. FL0890]|nr:hypothetical protein F5Y06DRAFT_187707 [Hypoxylon sp. FL0890]